MKTVLDAVETGALFSVVGKRVPRVDGPEKATGQAIYVDDISFPHMLCGKVLRSPLAHARIKNIDVSRALRLPGVKVAISAQDLPDTRHGPFIYDTPVLARGKVLYVGDSVAAVAAVDEDTALEALSLIDVEYEELPPIFDTDFAMSPEAPLVHENQEAYVKTFQPIQKGNICSQTIFIEGDVEAAFHQSDYVYEDSFTTQMVQQTPIETNGTVANYDISGCLTIWTSTQAPHLMQIRISDGLLIPINKIRVVGLRTGGGFGGKVEPKTQIIAAALAQRAGKPVKLVLTRKEEFTATSPRHSSKVTVKTGVSREGKILARTVKAVFDTGAYADDGPGITGFGGMMSLGPYKIPSYRIDGYCVYTNKMGAGAFRGFGNPQTAFATESHMDMVAERIGMDPVEFRLKNVLQNHDLSVGGIPMPSVGVKECLEKTAKAAGWGKSLGKNRGMGVACLQHISGVLSSSAIVRIHGDGTATVFTGAIDIGQGSDTVLSQIAAEELGLPLESVGIVAADTASSPYNWAVTASRITRTNGNAVRLAAADAKRQILELAARFLEVTAEELEIIDGQISVKGSPERAMKMHDIGGISHWATRGPIIGSASVMVEGHKYDPEKVMGFPFGTMAGFVFGSHIVELEVDEATGRVQVVNAVAAHDVGKAVNPTGVEGQIQGGLVQGLGYALFEEIVYDEKGKVINDTMLDYKIPTALDAPHITSIIVEETDPGGPFGAKGVGEPTLVGTAPAIANAVKRATGIRIKDLPISMEKLWRELKKL